MGTSDTQWACITQLGPHELRRGSWHPVLDLSQSDIVVLEVNGAPLDVPRTCVALHTDRRVAWSVVYEPDAPSKLGALYGVCPCCLARESLNGHEVQLICSQCGFSFPIEWQTRT